MIKVIVEYEKFATSANVIQSKKIYVFGVLVYTLINQQK